MRKAFFLFLLGFGLLSTVAAFADTSYHYIGNGRLLTNDLFGDGRDRWQTGSYSGTELFSNSENNDRFGDMISIDHRVGFVAPVSLKSNGLGDRPWAGYVSVGVHTPFKFGASEIKLGVDVIGIGPSVGMTQLQRDLHSKLNYNQPSEQKWNSQIPDQVKLGGAIEIARSYDLNGIELRPFIAAQSGLETLARAGFDMRIGPKMQDHFSRDYVTGFRYAVGVIAPESPMTNLIIGYDHAYVEQSMLFSDTHSATLKQNRDRVRLGIMHNRGSFGVFYGATWLSPEFDQQSGTGQIVGSLRLFVTF